MPYCQLHRWCASSGWWARWGCRVPRGGRCNQAGICHAVGLQLAYSAGHVCDLAQRWVGEVVVMRVLEIA